MSWCDKVASTPVIGVRLEPYYASGDRLFDALSSVVNKLASEDDENFKVDRHESFSIAFTTGNGFKYGVDAEKAHVEFAHRLQIRPVSGGAPIAQMLSTPAPYTAMLENVSNRLLEVVLRLPNINTRRLLRVGVISQTFIDAAEMPPGIARFVEYIGRPWRQDADMINIQVAYKVNSTDEYYDRCIHHVIIPEDKSKLSTLKFDWQRIYKKRKSISKETLPEILSISRRDALKYFEDLAEGDRFDESIGDESAGL